MEAIKKELDNVFGLVASISVKGNDVETMFAVRQGLRKAYSMLQELEANSKEKTEESANGT
jgi:hypothetical protein